MKIIPKQKQLEEKNYFLIKCDECGYIPNKSELKNIFIGNNLQYSCPQCKSDLTNFHFEFYRNGEEVVLDQMQLYATRDTPKELEEERIKVIQSNKNQLINFLTYLYYNEDRKSMDLDFIREITMSLRSDHSDLNEKRVKLNEITKIEKQNDQYIIKENINQ